MAFDMKIMAVPRPGSPGWELDCVSWLAEPLPKSNSFRSTSRDEGFRDFIAVLSAEEMREWHDRDRHRAAEGIYADAGWQRVLRPKIAELDRVLSEHPVPLFFGAWSYEWESGMN